jgi:hypothetical protein
MFRLPVLLILMALMQPAIPLGWWSECRKCRERQRLREELQREVDQIEKLKRPRSYPYFQLDVF